jgi:hypothetical protein
LTSLRKMSFGVVLLSTDRPAALSIALATLSSKTCQN